mmetsp:Transcript_22344/g.71449  ORF Transcript_22344/g.71449 Transcript_22344/m.71449 type:complete len:307 (-) Transcript_22344:1630-2550(-)
MPVIGVVPGGGENEPRRVHQARKRLAVTLKDVRLPMLGVAAGARHGHYLLAHERVDERRLAHVRLPDNANGRQVFVARGVPRNFNADVEHRLGLFVHKSLVGLRGLGANYLASCRGPASDVPPLPFRRLDSCREGHDAHAREHALEVAAPVAHMLRVHKVDFGQADYQGDAQHAANVVVQRHRKVQQGVAHVRDDKHHRALLTGAPELAPHLEVVLERRDLVGGEALPDGLLPLRECTALERVKLGGRHRSVPVRAAGKAKVDRLRRSEWPPAFREVERAAAGLAPLLNRVAVLAEEERCELVVRV